MRNLFAVLTAFKTVAGTAASIVFNYISPSSKHLGDTLFVTDLDGTFLTPEKTVSKKTLKTINRLLNKGLLFTAATARTPATVTEILKGLNLRLPVICMNGSALYCLKNNKYIFYHTLKPSAYLTLTEIFAEYDSTCFIHIIKDNHLYVFYDKIRNKAQQEFYNERKNLPLKTYINQKERPCKNGDVIFLMLLDKTEKINKIYEDILTSHISEEISVTKYIDIYDRGKYSYLEVYDKEASKKNGVRYLKDYTKAKKVVTFGDNANDISMMTFADYSFAVANSTDEVKAAADSVIGSNKDDSVAKAILSFIK